MSDPVQREIDGLALGVVPTFNDSVRLRAASWFNLVHQLGIHIPFPVIADLGQLFTIKRSTSSAAIAPDTIRLNAARVSTQNQELVREYARLVVSLTESEVVQRCQAWKLNDDVVAVLLTKILTPVFRSWPLTDKAALARTQLPLDVQRYKLDEPQRLIPTADAEYFASFLRALLERELQIRHAIEQLDIDTLRLLGLFQGDMGTQSPLEMVDLLGLFTTPMVNDIVNFSLQIIPSVLETHKHRDAQTASMDGFEGVERIGHLDNLLLTEFAYDDDIFFQKFIDNELFFYARSRAREEEKKLHYLLVDSSASMRGRRSVFARGVALAMIKKLILQGEAPLLRFFDSQLYEQMEVHAGFSVPYLLSFRSERGRNYRKVFEQLLFDIRRLRERRQQDVMLYILTHGQCHLPNDLVMRLREVAYLFGIFILPGDKLELSYVEFLHKSRTVGEEALKSSSNRKRAAIDILDQV